MDQTENSRQHQFLRHFAVHEPAIRAFVRRLVQTRTDADDVLQEVAVVLWDKFDSFQAGRDFRAWAYGVARFEVLAWLRDKRRDRIVLSEEVVTLLADDATAADSQLDRQRQALERCLEKIEQPQRTLLLRAYEPRSQIHAVARDSGRSLAGFYQWLHRMRRLLADCTRSELGETPA